MTLFLKTYTFCLRNSEREPGSKKTKTVQKKLECKRKVSTFNYSSFQPMDCYKFDQKSKIDKKSLFVWAQSSDFDYEKV